MDKSSWDTLYTGLFNKHALTPFFSLIMQLFKSQILEFLNILKHHIFKLKIESPRRYFSRGIYRQ